MSVGAEMPGVRCMFARRDLAYAWGLSCGPGRHRPTDTHDSGHDLSQPRLRHLEKHARAHSQRRRRAPRDRVLEDAARSADPRIAARADELETAAIVAREGIGLCRARPGR